jgi:hypothetical protein
VHFGVVDAERGHLAAGGLQERFHARRGVAGLDGLRGAGTGRGRFASLDTAVTARGAAATRKMGRSGRLGQ